MIPIMEVPMFTKLSRSIALVLAALLSLAGCVPLNSVPLTPPHAKPLSTPAPSAPAAGPAIAQPALTRVSSERLLFTTGALARPVPLEDGLYRVGSIDVRRDGAFVQTLDVVMDQPNTEWVTLPLRQDDLDFDGNLDLIITQPVGAKWGRLHAWLDDPATGRFVTNTLTAELGQLRVGDFRMDPDKQEIIISNSLGMTPFETAYRTTDSYLLPAFPPPGPADAGSCPAKAPAMLLLREDGHAYCLLYPEGFEANWPNAEEVVIREPGSAGYGAQVSIRESELGEKTVEQVADELLARIAAVTPTADHEPLQVRRSSGTLAGEPAVILDGMPGQDIGRVVLVEHGGRLYEMTFVPADRANEAYTLMDALFAIVTSSFRFLPAPAPTESPSGAAENIRGLLAKQLHVDPAAVKIVRATPTEWPDGCLGAATEDEICPQAITPGFELAYKVDGAAYRYHSDPNGYRARLVEAPPPAIGETVIAWTGQSDDGACRTANIGLQGVAFAPCGGVFLGGKFATAERAGELASFVAKYAPFETTTPSGRIRFDGKGQTRASEAEQQVLAEWAWLVQMEAVAGIPLPEMVPDVRGQPGAPADLNASCLPATETTQRLFNTDGHYCLSYPAEYKVEKPNRNETILVIGGLLDAASPRLHIKVSDAAGATADSTADHIVKDFEGFTLERSTTTVGGEPAVVLDRVPGQDINRRVIFVHEGLLYELYIAPADATLGEVYERMEALQAQVLGSFAFLPRDAAPVSDCLTPTNETRLFDDASRGFCLLYPSGFTAKTPSQNSVLIYAGSLQNAHTPRLRIETGNADGRTAKELADAAVGEIQAATPSLQIERVGGVTLGYQPVERLDGMPDQDLSLQIIGVKDGRAYRLIFMPDDPGQGDLYRQMEGLYDLVLKSFRFL
jgi:hypothetical protein